MRILYIIDHLGLGGAQTALAELVAHWPENDDQLTVVGLGYHRGLQARFNSNSRVQVESLECRRWSLAALRYVTRMAKTGNYDIIHSHLVKSLLAGMWAAPRANAKLVMHVHGDPQHDSRYLRWTLRWGWRRADALIAVSKHTMQATRQQMGIPAERMHLIYNPLASQAADDREKVAKATKIRCDLGISPESLALGYVGRLTDIKGLNYLMQSLEQISSSHRNLHAVLVGDGPEAERLKIDAVERDLADRVHFVGVQSEVLSWLEAFDVAVFPSLTEGLPLAVLEAMQAGLPVIASRVGGIPEVIDDGRSGLLIRPGDTDSLAQAIMTLAESPQLRRQLGETAHDEISTRFAADHVACQVRGLYEQLVDG